jgi:DNA-binding NtrC family response regulator
MDGPVRPASQPGRPMPPIVAASPAMRALLATAERVAQSDAKVLITGESGVGKDLVARVVHACSPRAARPYVAVNCAGVAETLLESELFGHLRGSFTGAYRDKPGLVQQADGGTLFLDEVGETSLRMQALLLRFLETGEIQQVGAHAPTGRANVRIIAATNRDLDELVAAGRFREDLYYRLRVVHLHVPPLRERREDIRPLLERLIAGARRPVTITEAAVARLEAWHWPGNVRELQNAVEQAVWTAPGEVVDVEHLPAYIAAAGAPAAPRPERRRQVADDLFEALVAGRCSFWGDVHRLFMARDLTRRDIREIVRRGLAESRGSYRALARLLRLPAGDYGRFLAFLAEYDCHLDPREFRRGAPGPRTIADPVVMPDPPRAAKGRGA